MLRKASTTLVCVIALVAPAYCQDVFVPRELKAVPLHPAKPKEVVRRAEPVTDADLNAIKEPAPKVPKAETSKVKTEKPAPKQKFAEEATSKKTASSEPVKEKSDRAAAPKEKSPSATKQPSVNDVATTKADKATAKEPPPTKSVAKTETAKEKKEKASPLKEQSDSAIPVIKVEKATVSREPATKTVAKTEPQKVEPAKEKTEKPAALKERPASDTVAKTAPAKNETAVAKTEKPANKDEALHKSAAKNEGVKVETATAKAEKPIVQDKPATVAASRTLREEKGGPKHEPVTKVSNTEAAKPEVIVAKTEKPSTAKEKEKPAPGPVKPPAAKTEALIAKVDPAPPREGPVATPKLPVKAEQVSVPSQKDPAQILPIVTGSLDTGFTKIADGFDFPVGKPEAEGYYKARGFRAGGHVGEDWDGVRGGDTDLRDPIYSIGDGIVVFARDVHLGWGNVVIVRHAYRDNGNVRYVDALYGHLNSMLVSRGQRVTRGQQIATMGTAHGQYDAHLHFEVRKNLEIGMSRSKFQKDFSNYYDPTQFINSHRHLSGGGANYKVAMNTFTHDWAFHFDSNRNFGARKRSTSESSAALHKAVTSR
ncbi:MAG TPA: peptidoglycan DD-metalloendopeptidase family protein [Chthoniobacterales bacterium]|nr:peptidoglycan DD-metalloendopeptidase family protein [Chthoniobacterales bacterium]